MKHRLLLVDDDAFHLDSSREFLERRGFQIDTARSGAEAMDKLRALPFGYSVIVLDYQMVGQNGAAATEALISINPKVFILIFSADQSRDAVLHSTRNGAKSFVDKREGADVFLREIKRLCAKFEDESAPAQPSRSAEENQKLIARIEMVGCSNALASLSNRVLALRRKQGSVLILGESGTGKEHVARALARPGEPFKAVNCADFLLNKETARSELFGHVRGAFTGADTSKAGLFEEAGAGTLFLDEIHALPLEAQMGLLRALQERVVRRLGGNEEIEIHCRVIAAGKPNLVEEIAHGRFKADLFYRISQNILSVPTLNQRPEDIAPLVTHFCAAWEKENGERRGFHPSCLSLLARYPWPGNARELENFVFSTLNLCNRKEVRPVDLQARFCERGGEIPTHAGSIVPLRSYLEETERRHLTETLGCVRSLKEAAERLGLRPSNLIRTLAKHNLKASELLAAKLPKEGATP